MLPLVVVLFLPCVLGAQKFYPDDPLEKEPPPMHGDAARFRKLNDYVDQFQNILDTTAGTRGRRSQRTSPGGGRGTTFV
jgi:hypothetical protein